MSHIICKNEKRVSTERSPKNKQFLTLWKNLRHAHSNRAVVTSHGMVCLSAFLTTKRLGFFLDFDLNSNTSKEWQDLTHSPLGILPKNAV